MLKASKGNWPNYYIYNNKMKVYTKKGDDGNTDLLEGVRVSKDDLTISAIGTFDELSSILGVARSKANVISIYESIKFLQSVLFEIGSFLAGFKKAELCKPEVLEKAIDEIERNLPEMTRFVLPGGTEVAALLHHARSICRRSERIVVSLAKKNKDVSVLLPLVNRISDFLFVLARYVNHKNMVKETEWVSQNEINSINKTT